MPITQINGIQLHATLGTQTAPPQGENVTRGEHSPLAKGRTKFTKSSLNLIKARTIGRPKTRATEITRSALKTTHRAVGEALKAASLGDAGEAARWMTQARKNLEPMLKQGVLGADPALSGEALDPEAVADEVLMARFQKHLSQMDPISLSSLEKFLDPKNGQLPGFPSGLRALVGREITSRAGKMWGDIKNELGNPDASPRMLARMVENDIGNILKLAASALAIEGKDPGRATGMIERSQLALLAHVGEPDRIKAVAMELSPEFLASALASAKPPLLEILQDAFSEKLLTQTDWSHSARTTVACCPTKGMECIRRAKDSYESACLLLNRAGDNASPNLKDQLKAQHKANLEIALTTIAEDPELMNSIPSLDLRYLIDQGHRFGISLTRLPGNEFNFIQAANKIAQTRLTEALPKFVSQMDDTMVKLLQQPPDGKKAREAVSEVYQNVVKDIQPHYAILDLSQPGDYLDGSDPEQATSMWMTHYMSCTPETRANPQAMIASLRASNASDAPLLNLPYRTQKLDGQIDLFLQASTVELNALHKKISEEVVKSPSDNPDLEFLKSNQQLIERRLLSKNSALVDSFLDARTHETLFVWGALPNLEGNTIRSPRIFRQPGTILASAFARLGMGAFLDAPFLNFVSSTPGAHVVDFGHPRFKKLSDHYTEVRLRAGNAWPGKQISADRILAASTHARKLMSQYGVTPDQTNTAPLEPV